MTAPCPLCAADSPHQVTMPVDAKTFRPTKHGAIYRCAACDFGFVHPRPDDTSAFYDLEAYYTQGQSHMAKVPPPGFLSWLRAHLAWRVDRGETLPTIIESEIPAGSSIVDIGCGGGWLLEHMGAKYRMTGVERDVEALASKRLSAVRGSAEALPDIGPFDAAVFSHVIEHLVDPVAALRSAAKLLRPGGVIVIEVPNNESRAAEVSGLSWEHLDVPRHVNFFTRQSLVALGCWAGLAVKRTYFTGYCRYFTDSHIATEQRIHDRLPSPQGSTRNSQARAWRLLAGTAAASARRKYDSVGIVLG